MVNRVEIPECCVALASRPHTFLRSDRGDQGSEGSCPAKTVCVAIANGLASAASYLWDIIPEVDGVAGALHLWAVDPVIDNAALGTEVDFLEHFLSHSLSSL